MARERRPLPSPKSQVPSPKSQVDMEMDGNWHVTFSFPTSTSLLTHFIFHSSFHSIPFRAVHRSKTGLDRTGTGLDRNRNHVFWWTGDRTGIIPVQTCPDLFIQVRSGFGPVWTCFVFFNIYSLKSQNLHNKFSS